MTRSQTMEGRTRLHTEILQAVQKVVGSDNPIAIRFGACDYTEGGSQKEEIPKACRIFANAGDDLLDISSEVNSFMIKGISEPGWFSELSMMARNSVRIPVLLTGGINTWDEAEALLQKGAAHLIGVGRAMLKKADWAAEAMA